MGAVYTRLICTDKFNSRNSENIDFIVFLKMMANFNRLEMIGDLFWWGQKIARKKVSKNISRDLKIKFSDKEIRKLSRYKCNINNLLIIPKRTAVLILCLAYELILIKDNKKIVDTLGTAINKSENKNLVFQEYLLPILGELIKSNLRARNNKITDQDLDEIRALDKDIVGLSRSLPNISVLELIRDLDNATLFSVNLFLHFLHRFGV